MAIVLAGGEVALGILERGELTVRGVGVGDVVLGQHRTHGALDLLHAVVGVIDRLGYSIATFGDRQVSGAPIGAVKVVVGGVRHRNRCGLGWARAA
ncbi:hypothetical protein D3C78_1477390 [compost metagenome]